MTLHCNTLHFGLFLVALAATTAAQSEKPNEGAKTHAPFSIVRCVLLVLTALLLVSAPVSADDWVLLGNDGHWRFATHRYGRMVAVDGDRLYVGYMSNDAVTGSRVVAIDVPRKRVIVNCDIGGALARGKRDDHNYPTIALTENGALHAFFGCHCTPLLYRRGDFHSSDPVWSATTEVSELATYPRVFADRNGRRLLVFFRQGHGSANPVSFGYIESNDMGQTWSAFRPVISEKLHDGINAWPYVGGVYLDGEMLHIAVSWWVYHSDGTTRKEYDDPCYFRHRLGSDTVEEAGGNILAAPVTRAQLTPVQEDKHLDVLDLTIDGQGRPVILLYDGKNQQSHLAWWTGEAWKETNDHVRPDHSSYYSRFAQNVLAGQVVLCIPQHGGKGVQLLGKREPKEPWGEKTVRFEPKGNLMGTQCFADRDVFHVVCSEYVGKEQPARVWWVRTRNPW